MKKTRLLLVVLALIMFLFTSCHSKYINLAIRTDGTIAWNNDSSAFAFVAKTELFRSPVGIAKFPDGGMITNEYLDFALYHFDIKHNKLTRLAELNDFYLRNDYRWSSIGYLNLDLQDTLLFYKLGKPSGYDLKNIKERHPDILINIAKTYKININTLKKETVDTTINSHLFYRKRENFRFSSAKKYLSNLKYADWGIVLKDIYPKSKKYYMDMIIEKEGNDKMRQAIFQQIIPDFTEQDKKTVLGKMEERMKELYEDYKNTDKLKDPYQRGLKKDKYLDYQEYLDMVKKRFKTYY